MPPDIQIKRATPQMRRVAKRLIPYSPPRKKSSEEKAPTLNPVTDKLRAHLATLMGKGGFRALLSRALVLATAEVSWLRAVHVDANGVLEGWETFYAELDAAEFYEGRVAVLAHLLGLLVALIGPKLTSRMMGEIWPELLFADIDFGKEAEDGKAK